MGTDFEICIQDLKKKLILNDQLYGYDKERNELLHIVKKTTDFGESDSVVILGPNGSGKSIVFIFKINTCYYCYFHQIYFLVNGISYKRHFTRITYICVIKWSYSYK